MIASMSPLPLHDLTPAPADLLEECRAGLRQGQKTLPCKFLYDERGSALFDQICELPEYYVTRTELAIMRAHAAEMAQRIGRDALVIELGSGSSVKTRLLLDQLVMPAGYVPVDISREHLWQAASRLAGEYVELPVMPVCADYLQPMTLPEAAREAGGRRAVYFPGSTIGNLHADQAKAFLGRIAKLVGRGGGLLIGVDLRKSEDVLLPAYNDAAGVTAAFNLNLLKRINREAGADFNVRRFRHEERWDATAGRVEMHLVSQTRQRVHMGGEVFKFEEGETILTECSYKRTLDEFAALARDSFELDEVWMDERGWFSVQWLRGIEDR